MGLGYEKTNYILYSAASVQWSESTHLHISELILTTYFSNNIFIDGNCILSFFPLFQSLLLLESNNKSWLIIKCYNAGSQNTQIFLANFVKCVTKQAAISWLCILAIYPLAHFLFKYHIYASKDCCRTVNK